MLVIELLIWNIPMKCDICIMKCHVITFYFILIQRRFFFLKKTLQSFISDNSCTSICIFFLPLKSSEVTSCFIVFPFFVLNLIRYETSPKILQLSKVFGFYWNLYSVSVSKHTCKSRGKRE